MGNTPAGAATGNKTTRAVAFRVTTLDDEARDDAVKIRPFEVPFPRKFDEVRDGVGCFVRKERQLHVT